MAWTAGERKEVNAEGEEGEEFICDFSFLVSDLKSEKRDISESGYAFAGTDSVVVWLNPSPNPVASQARHELVSPEETFASRIVVPCWEREDPAVEVMKLAEGCARRLTESRRVEVGLAELIPPVE